MFRNYVKVAVRMLFKNRAFAGINIFGLAVGIACCVLIFLYVEDELGYDRFTITQIGFTDFGSRDFRATVNPN